MARTTLRRRIRFHQLLISRGDSSHSEAPNFEQLLRLLDEQRRGRGSWKLPFAGGDSLLCGFVDAQAQMLSFCRIRLAGLPERFHEEDLLELELDEGDGLAEKSHVKFYADGVIGFEHNRDGPTVPQLVQYLNTVAGGDLWYPDGFLKRKDLLKRDSIEELGRIANPQAITINVLPRNINKLNDYVPIAYRQTRDGIEAEKVRARFSVDLGEQDRRSLLEKLQFWSSDAEFDREEESIIVGGLLENGRKARAVDLLQAYVETQMEVELHLNARKS